MNINKQALKGRFAVSLVKVLGKLPLKKAQTFGFYTGHLFWMFPSRMKRTSMQNIAYCFPDLSKKQQDALAKNSLVNTITTLVETASVWIQPYDDILTTIRHIDGIEILNQAIDAKQGVLIAAPHLGNWEALGVYLDRMVGITVMFKPGKIKELDELILSSRSQSNNNVVPANRRGIKACLDNLRAGGISALLPDQEPDKNSGVFAPFFGHPANSGFLYSKLLKSSSCKPILMFARRLKPGQGFEICVREFDEDIYSEDLLTSVAALNRGMENAILEYPEQWTWDYKRFKRTEDGSPSIYK